MYNVKDKEILKKMKDKYIQADKADKDRYNELCEKIKKLEAELKPLIKERQELIENINKKNMANQPFDMTGYTTGNYSITKQGIEAIYMNHRKHTYYMKPLYKADGKPYGRKISRKSLKECMEYAKENGYKLCE